MSQIKSFEAMLAKGEDGEMLRFTLGNACLAEERLDEAVTHLQRAVDFKPDYSAAWKQLGRALAANDEPVAALAAFKNGLRSAEAKGDKQTFKEITVFSRRVERLLHGGHKENEPKEQEPADG